MTGSEYGIRVLGLLADRTALLASAWMGGDGSFLNLPGEIQKEPGGETMRSENEAVQEAIKEEVALAMRQVAGLGRPSIRVLSSTEEVRFRFTCPRCRCHVASHFRMPSAGGSEVYKVCTACRAVYS